MLGVCSMSCVVVSIFVFVGGSRTSGVLFGGNRTSGVSLVTFICLGLNFFLFLAMLFLVLRLLKAFLIGILFCCLVFIRGLSRDRF